MNAIYGFELIVLSFFIAYTIFPTFKLSIHKGIDTFVKWSGFISLCVSMSILLINLLFNQKVSGQLLVSHTLKWHIILAVVFNLASFDLRLRSFFTGLLLIGISIKAYYFETNLGDELIFASVAIAFLNSLFSGINKYSSNFNVQAILSLFVLAASFIAFYNHALILKIIRYQQGSYAIYKTYILLCILGSVVGMVSFVLPRLLSLSLFVLPMVLSLLFMYTGGETLVVMFNMLLFFTGIMWTFGYNQKQVI